MHQLTRARAPQGADVTRVEDAADIGQLFGLSLALEDAVWLSNDDKRRTAAFVDQATRRIELQRLAACRWYQWTCQRNRQKLQHEIDVASAELARTPTTQATIAPPHPQPETPR